VKIPNLWDIVVALFVGPVEPDPDPEQVEFIAYVAYAPLWVLLGADEPGMDDPEADGVSLPEAEASAGYGPCDRVEPEPEAEP
jgi:hypothetical protein